MRQLPAAGHTGVESPVRPCADDIDMKRPRGFCGAGLTLFVVAAAASADSARTILGVDAVNNRILAFNPDTGEFVREVVGASSVVSAPFSIAPGPTIIQGEQVFGRTILVGDIRQRRIVVFDEVTGALLREWSTGVDANALQRVGDEWLAAGGRAGVASISSTGASSSRIAPEIVLGPNNAWGVLRRPATDSHSADILVSDATLDMVARFDSSGARLGMFARHELLRFPQQLASRVSGHVLLADSLANRVFEFDAAGGFVRTIACAHPRGVAELTNGNLLIASDDGVQVLDGDSGALLATTLSGLPTNAVRNLTVVTCSELAGDLNGDGRVNSFDIDPFVLALSDESAYHVQFPNVDRLCAGDINRDERMNSFDIDPFVTLLVGG